MRPDRRRSPIVTVAALILCAALLPARAVPAGEETPSVIRDNSFLIEEAYNQEPGVIQHILTGGWARLRQGGSSDDNWTGVFTQEWPVPNMTHQLSYTIPYTMLRGDQPHEEGFRDVLLNYRYQLVEEDAASKPAIAPRFSLILPTGDVDKGLGNGELGYVINIPFSKTIGTSWAVHLNAGVALTPGVEIPLEGGGHSEKRFLTDLLFGFSAIWLLRPDLNIMAEFLTLRTQDVDRSTGKEVDGAEVYFSPGLRYALNLSGGAQAVFGAAMPIGMTDDSEDLGIFIYASFEHALWEAK